MAKPSQDLHFEQVIRLAVSAPEPSGEFVRKMESQLSMLPDQAVPQSRSMPGLHLLSRFSLTGLQLAGWVALVALFIVTLTVVTPQGRALAENIVHFFTRSSSNVLPLLSPTPLSLVAVTPDVPAPTLTATPGQTLAFAGQCGDQSFPTCTFEQIRGMVSFPVKAISTDSRGLPFTLDFAGATGGPDQVWLVYRSKDKTQALFLIEGTLMQEGFQGNKIAADAVVESVQVGSAVGEYVKGTWGSTLVDGSLPWDPNMPVQSLRWMDGNMYYEMDAFGNPDKPAWWSIRQGFLELAAKLTSAIPTPTPGPYIDNLSLSEAEALAGFHILAPDQLPRDYIFGHASYSPEAKTVCLEYGSTLSIAESVDTPFPGLTTLLQYPAYATTANVAVGGAPGNAATLIEGNLNPDLFCTSKVDTPVGSYSPEDATLEFEVQGIKVSIYAKSSVVMNEQTFVTQLEMQKLAESITGVHTILAAQLDPGFLTNVADAQSFVRFKIKLPTKVHPGENISFFRIAEMSQSQWVMIYYDNPSNPMAIEETDHPTDSMDTFCESMTSPTMDSTCEQVTIHGQPGILFVAPGAEIEIMWIENGIEYKLWAIYDGQPTSTWLEIAESIQ